MSSPLCTITKHPIISGLADSTVLRMSLVTWSSAFSKWSPPAFWVQHTNVEQSRDQCRLFQWESPACLLVRVDHFRWQGVFICMKHLFQHLSQRSSHWQIRSVPLGNRIISGAFHIDRPLAKRWSDRLFIPCPICDKLIAPPRSAERYIVAAQVKRVGTFIAVLVQWREGKSRNGALWFPDCGDRHQGGQNSCSCIHGQLR